MEVRNVFDVSVVIPVFNDRKAIQLTLDALRHQTAGQSKFEIIVVDNGSTDGAAEWLEQQSDITFLKEHSYLNSPYSCRNRGIEVASGEYIALLDSTCIPAQNWVEAGLNFIKQNNCELFGGDVKFNCEKHKTAAKLYDSVMNVQMEQAIKTKQEAKTANLWVKKELFNTLGPFNEGVRSGEDVRWSSFAAANGSPLLFAPQCVVYKFARGFRALIKKHYRIGKGQILRWHKEEHLKSKFRQALLGLKPVNPKEMRVLIAKNDDFEYSTFLAVKLYVVRYFALASTVLGNLIGLIETRELRKNGH
jgi:glycosyltransferase involved in cell wall biosynthesis